MKNIELGQTITILANVGVIAGIIFLAFELRQNNDLLASQARATLIEYRVAGQQSIIENRGGIADLVFRARAGESLTETENWRLDVRRVFSFQNWLAMYQEVMSGPLPAEDIPVRQWAAAIRNDPGMLGVWGEVKDGYDPGFVRLMEEHVLPLASTD